MKFLLNLLLVVAVASLFLIWPVMSSVSATEATPTRINEPPALTARSANATLQACQPIGFVRPDETQKIAAVNIRSGSGTAFSVISSGGLVKSEPVSERSENGWYRLCSGGWVGGSVVIFSPTATSPTPTKTPTPSPTRTPVPTQSASPTPLIFNFVCPKACEGEIVIRELP